MWALMPSSAFCTTVDRNDRQAVSAAFHAPLDALGFAPRVSSPLK